MTINIRKSNVNYYPEHNFLKVFINANYDEQLPITIKELGKGEEDKYSIEYRLPNQTLITLWKKK